MNITTASALIAAALASGAISVDQATAANTAIREKMHYGMPMTPRSRKSIVNLRFGIEG
jgi:hypothetical protein